MEVTRLTREIVIFSPYTPTSCINDLLKDEFWVLLRDNIERVLMNEEGNVIVMGDGNAGC